MKPLPRLLSPFFVGLLTGCIALPLLDLLHIFTPAWNMGTLFFICFFAALEGGYAQHLIEARELRGMSVLRFRLVEFGMLFAISKAISLTGYPLTAIVSIVKNWALDPVTLFFEAQTLVGVVIAFLAWEAARSTAADIEAINYFIFTEFGDSTYMPLARLNDRFFWGGALLLVATGLSRTAPSELFNFNRTPLAGLLLNALIYFGLGLILLGQARYMALRKDWEMREIKIAPEVSGRWRLYSILFVGLAALAVFFLPTRYALNLLELFNTLVSVLFLIVFLLLEFIAWLISIPLMVLMRFLPILPPLPIPVPPWPAVRPPTVPAAPAADPMEFLKSFLFWAVFIGVLMYIVINYLRERPELWQLLKELTWVQQAQVWWAKLSAWWRAVWGPVGPRWIETWRERLFGGAAQQLESAFNFFRVRPRTPREQIFFFYLSLLQRAQQKGFARREPETPFEYEPTLEAHAPEAQGEAADLTQTFVQARYSSQNVSPEEVARAKAEWERVRQALKK